jgi:hypothetical protein
MTKMSCLDLVRHWQGFVEQKHGYSHRRIVFFEGLPRWVSTFIRNVFLVEEWERSDLYICHTILLCAIVMMLLRMKLLSATCR